jgi:hypothetical protein
MRLKKTYFIAGIVFCVSIATAGPVVGMPFGAPDSRSMAMGMTGVASAGSTHAGYFNPALLAAYSQRKHLGGNQRIAFPSLSGLASESTLGLEDIDDADYETNISSGVAQFNATANPDGLRATLEALQDDLRDTASNQLLADVHAHAVLRIPDRQQGGAFYLGSRAVFDGMLDYAVADEQLLEDYLEELVFVSEGGAPGTLHPELYTGGDLNDPADSLSSSADAVALLINEIAFSMGWAVSWWDVDMMVGVTPKIMQVTTREYRADAVSGNLSLNGEYEDDVTLNLDVGWAKQFGEQVTLGVAVKNLIPASFRTESGRSIDIDPQVRVGAAYRSKWGEYTADLDLVENDPLSRGDAVQMLGLGGEWTFGEQQIRAGLVKNLAGEGGGGSLIYTFGFRLRYGSYYSDFSYGSGQDHKAAALQLGLVF